MKIIYVILILSLIWFNYKLSRREFFNNRYENFSIVPKHFLMESEKLGFKNEIININPTKIKIYNGKKSCYVSPLSYSFNNNNYKNVILARNKFKTYNLLRLNGIPTPNFQLFQNINKNTANQILNKKNINYPIVAKIIDGANGDNVYVNLKNDSDLSYSIDRIVNNNFKELMIEEFISGKDYRILMFDNKIIDVLCRIPPFVIGNDKDNIKELVYNKNIHRREFGYRPIIIDYYYLKKCNFNTEYVPKKNQKIIVNPLANFHKGADLQRVNINDIHNDNKNLFIKISKIMNLKIIGIDFISKNLNVSYLNQGKVNEVNGIPNLDLHYYANNEKNTKVFRKILEIYFK